MAREAQVGMTTRRELDAQGRAARTGMVREEQVGMTTSRELDAQGRAARTGMAREEQVGMTTSRELECPGKSLRVRIDSGSGNAKELTIKKGCHGSPYFYGKIAIWR